MSNGSFDVDFTKTSNIYSTPFNNIWGSSSEWSLSSTNGLWLGSAGTNYTPMGLMQTPSGNSAGEGYGAYSYTARYEYPGQNGGDYLLLWRADDTWLDSSKPGTITEMDMLETWDNSKTAMSTMHYYNTASNNNGQIFHGTSNLNLTQNHVYTLDWEAGSINYYVDGKLSYTITGSSVPKDTAHGGNNQVMGVGAETETASVGMYIREAQYTSSADLATAGGVANVMAAQIGRMNGSSTVVTPPVTAPPVTTPPVTTPTPVLTSIAVSAPGTVMETSVGAGVTVTETITAPHATTLYEATFTSSNVMEANWQAVAINSSGVASYQASFQHSGDYVVVVDNTTAATVQGWSTAIKITDAVVPPPVVVTPPVVVPPVVVPPVVVPPVVVPPVAATSFTLSSVTEVAGKLVVIGDKESGSPATVREVVDGHYLGVIEDHAADGKFSFSLADVAAGSHTMVLSLDGSSLTASMKFITGSAMPVTPVSPVTPVVPVTPVTPVTPVVPVVPVVPMSGFSISSLTENNGTLTLVGSKEIGSAATMRETMDGHYLGTLQDHMADGAFSMQIADVTAGAHKLGLSLDGSSATATYDFTKLANGSILHAVVATSSASASTLIAVTHNT